ncbi:proline--tRNA ligase [bacterium DOLJORAL78_65_58]|nr:MAG: proline--tRNA ligase [bacterium DOLZORAL124_64_63]PIE76141.1 MAG: proline--tRNA ligase [bacterium DOLJORAL78_65_58]
MAEITKRSEDYSRWYQDVIQAAELAENSPVRGCMVIRPNGYAIWENIQRTLDDKFKELGHVNAYFPLLIPKSFLAKEAEHVEGFAKECAIVTHHRLKQVTENGKVNVIPDPESKLEEEYIIRPTSETVIWDQYRKWIQSYRDLPILINQWANVMRWEMRTRMFLRTTEFLWQEGHTAHATAEEGREETLKMLEVYRWFAEEMLAMPVVPGPKTANERFAGAVETFSIEAMMQDRKALQAATSHDLGQNFAKAFDVKYQSAEGQVEHVWATSWGMSTRIMGALIMTHSDDNGLVLPPRIAGTKAVIVPIWRKDEEMVAVVDAAEKIAAELRPLIGPVHVDKRDNMRPGWKYAEWERKGVPLRMEIGPRDLNDEQVMLAARHDRKKQPVKFVDLADAVPRELERIQQDLYNAAKKRLEDATCELNTWEEFTRLYEGDGGFSLCHWCGDGECEQTIQDKTKVTIRNIPFQRDETPGECIHCGKKSIGRVLFAQAY